MSKGPWKKKEKDRKLGAGETPDPKPEDQEAEIKKWHEVIKTSEDAFNQWKEQSGAKRFIDEYANDWKHLQQSVDIPLINVNLVYAYTKTEIARLYFRDPWITVNAKRVEDLGAAKIAEQLVNYTWGELDLKRQVKLALLDAILVGHGWIKTGYTAQIGIAEDKTEEGKKKDGAELDVNEFVKSESVFATHYPWDHVLFDGTATWPPTHNARWMAFKWTKPLRAVQESGIYDKDAVEDLKPSGTGDSMKDTKDPTRNVQSVTAWEIWDKDHKKVITIVPGHNKKLREIDWPDYMTDGFPVTMFSFNPIPGRAYPMSDIAPFEGQVVEMTKMMAIMINHLKRWNRQVFTKPGLMEPTAKENFAKSVDGAIIECQGDFGKDFYIPPYAPVQQDIYGVWNLTKDIFKTVAGQSDTEQGANVKSTTRTLGELRLALQGGRARSDEKVDALEDSISEIARKLLMIMQKKYDLPKIVRIVGTRAMEKAFVQNRPSAQGANAQSAYTGEMNGQIESFSATKEDIHGEMDVDTLAGSTIPLNKENQLQIMEKLMPNLQFLGIQPNSKAAVEFAREYFRLIDMKSVERIADIAEQEIEEMKQHPQPNPDMVKLQAEMQMKQQEGQMKAQEGQMKMQVEQQKGQLQLQGLEAKVQAEVIKAKIDIEKAEMDKQKMVLQHILSQQRPNGNGSRRNE